MVVVTKRIWNLIIQSINTVIRFLFFFYLTKLLVVEEYGSYILFTANVGFGVSFIGLEFYVYSNREITRTTDLSKRIELIVNHLWYSLFAILFLLPFLLLIIDYSSTVNIHIFWLFVIVALEYLNQEVVRFFNACSNQLTSSVLLFIRQSFWPILIFGAHLFNHSVNLSLIFSLWAISNLIVLLTSFFFVKKFYQKSVFNSFNFNWIKKGLIFAFFFFLSAISFKALFTVDRNYISNYFSNEVLSAYGFYFALSALLMSIIEPLIFSFFLVDVIKLAESGNITKIRSEIIKYTMQILCVSIGLFLVVFWGSNFLLEILERDSFKHYINLFYIFLTIQTFWAISILFQYVLYSFHKDIVNILSNVISFLVFLALIIPIGVQFGYVGIPVFILIASIINLVVKGFYYLKTIYF